MEELIKKIKDKKEFNELQDSIVKRVLEIKEFKLKGDNEKIKSVRAFLRKYFSVFMTNKIIGGKLSPEEIIKKHISTKNRDYSVLYPKFLIQENVVIDLGAGLNGLSYNFFPKDIRYLAVEAIGVFVRIMNSYFKENNLNALAVQEDLFNLEDIVKIIKKEQGTKLIFLFNVIDALERVKKDYSKELISAISQETDRFIISFPIQSLTGKVKFKAKRYWLLNFLEDNFNILESFELSGERFIIFRKK